MTSRKNAAIILLGMGENNAAEILKTMGHKEVEAIIEVMNTIDEVSEDEVIKALNDFFKESQRISSINPASGNYMINTLVNAIGPDKAESMINLEEAGKSTELAGLELLKWQSTQRILDALQEEHPQVITTALMYLESDQAAAVLKHFSQELRKEIIMRMTNYKQVSHVALKSLSDYLHEQFTQTEKFKNMSSDGVKIAAGILSKLDPVTESEILKSLKKDDRAMTERIEDSLLPFEKLAEMDARSIQVLLAELDNDDLVLALKGVDEAVKAVFFKNMSIKNVRLIQEDIENLGPVKLNDVLIAQKQIVEFAKRLSNEEKIWLPTNNQNTIR